METFLLVVIGILLLLVALLAIKIRFMQKAAEEISEAFSRHLTEETNTLIDISSGDRYMRRLAGNINGELRKLRSQRHRFIRGDAELKNAVTNISHDLRTPLTAICGYLDLLDAEEKSEDAKRYIEIIKNRSEMLISLTEELFRYSVIVSADGAQAKESVCVNDVLEESIAAFYTALREKGIEPQIKMPKVNVIRTLDRSALTRVFSNLLSNAVKYSDGDLSVSLSESGEAVFTNTASKLDKVQVGKLFDRFYAVETAGKSTGLGLSIARTLTEQMNGTITADWENDKLTVCVSFSE